MAVDPPGTTRTKLEKIERDLAMSGHFRGVLKTPWRCELNMKHSHQKKSILNAGHSAVNDLVHR